MAVWELCEGRLQKRSNFRSWPEIRMMERERAFQERRGKQNKNKHERGNEKLGEK